MTGPTSSRPAVPATADAKTTGEPTLFVLVGLPASGKSTWARKQNATTVTLDGIRLHGQDPSSTIAAAEHHAAHLLTAGHDVIVDACSLDPRRRARWLTLAHHAGAQAVAVLMACDWHTATRRNAARRTTHTPAVPAATMARYRRQWHHTQHDAAA